MQAAFGDPRMDDVTFTRAGQWWGTHHDLACRAFISAFISPAATGKVAVHVGIGAKLFYKVHLDWDSVRVLRIDEFERLRTETQNDLIVVFWGDASEYLI